MESIETEDEYLKPLKDFITICLDLKGNCEFHFLNYLEKMASIKIKNDINRIMSEYQFEVGGYLSLGLCGGGFNSIQKTIFQDVINYQLERMTLFQDELRLIDKSISEFILEKNKNTYSEIKSRILSLPIKIHQIGVFDDFEDFFTNKRIKEFETFFRTFPDSELRTRINRIHEIQNDITLSKQTLNLLEFTFDFLNKFDSFGYCFTGIPLIFDFDYKEKQEPPTMPIFKNYKAQLIFMFFIADDSSLSCVSYVYWMLKKHGLLGLESSYSQFIDFLNTTLHGDEKWDRLLSLKEIKVSRFDSKFKALMDENDKDFYYY